MRERNRAASASDRALASEDRASAAETIIARLRVKEQSRACAVILQADVKGCHDERAGRGVAARVGRSAGDGSRTDWERRA